MKSFGHYCLINDQRIVPTIEEANANQKKPFDCPYCDYKCVQKENIYVYNIHGHKEY